jgi:SIT4-associating protein SAP185/190
MAIHNRPVGTGPKYIGEGVLHGLDSLELLGDEIERPDQELETENLVTQARELPVSTGSTDASISESSDLPSDDDDTPPPTLHADPPPPSQADVARLREVRDSDLRGPTGSDMASASHVATAASVASDHPTEGPSQPSSLGDALKQQYLTCRVVPTVIELFFEYKHNDFAHHVIYDLLQQILNGRLGPGLNRELVVEIIKEGRIVERILDAQRLNDHIV